MKNILLLLVILLLLTACGSNNEESDINEEGTVTIISNGEEIEPFKSWAHGEFTDEDGQTMAGDAPPLTERVDIASLNTVIYSSDFEVKVTGNPRGIIYRTFTDDLGVYSGSSSYSGDITIPSEKGLYILSTQVRWGVTGNYNAYDYFFKLLIE